MANRLLTKKEFEQDIRDAFEALVPASPPRPPAPRETRHLFRPQRSSLRRAMWEAREFDGTRAGLQSVLSSDEILHEVTAYGGIDIPAIRLNR